MQYDRFLKVKAKVSGFLVIKVLKRNAPNIEGYQLTAKNAITGLAYLINAFATYMKGVPYNGATALSSGIVITTSTGQTITVPLIEPPLISATNNSVIISFIAIDDSNSSYTATNEQLITKSAGYNIPIATANLTITKNSDEVLTLTWTIIITISTSNGISYIPTQILSFYTPGCGSCGNGCYQCIIPTANSLFQNNCTNCSNNGIPSQYQNSNLITMQLFVDMFFNYFKPGSPNPFVSYSNSVIYIYTLYCMGCFMAGIANAQPNFVSYQNGNMCYTNQNYMDSIYIQICTTNKSPQYIGVQIELTT